MDLKTKSRIAILITSTYFVLSAIIIAVLIRQTIVNTGFIIIYAIIIGSGAIFYWFIEYTEKIRFAILKNKK